MSHSDGSIAAIVLGTILFLVLVCAFVAMVYVFNCCVVVTRFPGDEDSNSHAFQVKDLSFKVDREYQRQLLANIFKLREPLKDISHLSSSPRDEAGGSSSALVVGMPGNTPIATATAGATISAAPSSSETYPPCDPRRLDAVDRNQSFLQENRHPHLRVSLDMSMQSEENVLHQNFVGNNSSCPSSSLDKYCADDLIVSIPQSLERHRKRVSLIKEENLEDYILQQLSVLECQLIEAAKTSDTSDKLASFIADGELLFNWYTYQKMHVGERILEAADPYKDGNIPLRAIVMVQQETNLLQRGNLVCVMQYYEKFFEPDLPQDAVFAGASDLKRRSLSVVWIVTCSGYLLDLVVQDPSDTNKRQLVRSGDSVSKHNWVSDIPVLAITRL